MTIPVSDPVYQKISQDPFARWMGIGLQELRPGYSRVAMMLTPQMVNFHGIPHGGAIFALADAAFATASNSHGQTAVALSIIGCPWSLFHCERLVSASICVYLRFHIGGARSCATP